MSKNTCHPRIVGIDVGAMSFIVVPRQLPLKFEAPVAPLTGERRIACSVSPNLPATTCVSGFLVLHHLPIVAKALTASFALEFRGMASIVVRCQCALSRECLLGE